MLHEFAATLGQMCHMAGLLIILYGALLLTGAMFANAPPLAFLKGVAFIAVGTFFAGIV